MSVSYFEELIEDVCPDMPVSNCGSCNKTLISTEAKKKYKHHAAGLDVVFLRARGVPFCRSCSSDGEVRFVLRARAKGGA